MNPIKTNSITEDGWVPAVNYQTGSANNTSSSPVYFSGFDFEDAYKAIDNNQYLKPIPEISSVDGGLVGD